MNKKNITLREKEKLYLPRCSAVHLSAFGWFNTACGLIHYHKSQMDTTLEFKYQSFYSFSQSVKSAHSSLEACLRPAGELRNSMRHNIVASKISTHKN
jgi:hypothetical protein